MNYIHRHPSHALANEKTAISGRDGARTRDLYHVMVALCQLSYAPLWAPPNISGGQPQTHFVCQQSPFSCEHDPLSHHCDQPFKEHRVEGSGRHPVAGAQ